MTLDTLKRNAHGEFDKRAYEFNVEPDDGQVIKAFLDTQIARAYLQGVKDALRDGKYNYKRAIQDALKVVPKKIYGVSSSDAMRYGWNKIIDTITQALKKLEGGV